MCIFLFLLIFSFVAIATFLFVRTTVVTFDRKAKENGIHPLAPVIFFPSGHVFLYAMALTLPPKLRANLASANQLNIEAIKEFETKSDKLKAILFLGCIFMLIVFVFTYNKFCPA
jgi:hypothetical protein